MPPPRGTRNPLEGPGDYDTTPLVHNDSYEAISPLKADFSGKAVLITGASKGCGKAAGIAYAQAGASYIAICARSELSSVQEELLSAATKANRKAPQMLCLKLDVSDKASVAEAAAAVEAEFGRLDVLVNNAGVFEGLNLIHQSDPDEWWRTWEVNVRGPYLMVRAFLPLMLKAGEKTIVTTASVGAHKVMDGMSSYQTGKLAVLRLTEFFSAEYASQGVISYCIHPGNIPTEIVGGMEGVPEELKPVFVETPELSADTIVFLTSKRREWLRGRYINCTWDMPQLMEKEREIVEGDKLKVRLVI